MKFKKPKFWDYKKPSIISYLLLPISVALKILRMLINSIIKKKKYNSVILNYDKDSEDLFKWYQQLVGESLGKKQKGAFPIISTMPKDNHSLMQLYLDGPKNNFFTFFSVNEKKSEKIINSKLLKSYSFTFNSCWDTRAI